MWKNNMTYGIAFYVVILATLNGIEAQRSTAKKPSKVCSGYGYQVWLSCITNPCLFASCPAFGKLAECRKEISEDCKTCRAAYLNGRRVNCHLRNFDCPPGLPLQQCVSDPCHSTECIDPRFKGAECRGYYCGGCLAEYFVDGKWQQCPNADVKLQGDAPLLLPEIRRAMIDFSTEPRREGVQGSASSQSTCPDGSPQPQCPPDACVRAECPQFSRATCVVNKCQGCKPEFYFRGQLVDCQSTKCAQNVLEMACPDDPCKYATCPLYPGAECRPSNCGYCHPEWFINNKEVNCFSRMPDNYQCPNGLQQQQCPRNTCRFKRCLKDADTFCRVNNCGGCYAEYVNTQNEIVDCVGWWTRYENKKPKELTEANNIPAVNGRVDGGASGSAATTNSNSSGGKGTSNPVVASGADKEMEIDALFGNLGLLVPPNTEIVSSAVNSNPSASSSWNTLTTDNSKNQQSQSTSNGPVDSSLNQKPQENVKMINNGLKMASQITVDKSQNGTPKSASKGLAESPINQKAARKTETINDGLKMGSQKPVQKSENSSAKSKDNSQTAGKTSNKEQTKLPDPSPLNLFRSIAIPLDSLNKNSNFRPGIPIGAWHFRSKQR